MSLLLIEFCVVFILETGNLLERLKSKNEEIDLFFMVILLFNVTTWLYEVYC